MSKNVTIYGMLAILMGLSGSVVAEDKSESADIESTISKDAVPSCIGACYVNFKKELGSTLGYLDSIGHTIHEARKTPDPVQLALCSRGLHVAESVSGKKASVTSSQVMKEAIQLAKLRGYSEELAGIAALADGDDQADLTELAAVARETEQAVKKATAKGESNKELIGTLKVINHSHECLKIYMDGHYLGTVHSGHTRSFRAHSHRHHNHFDAYCEEGGELVEHADYSGHAHNLNWHIH